MKENPVKFTGTIPICPNCNQPTKRTGGTVVMTALYYSPVYDEQGNSINPDRNTQTSSWLCEACDKPYWIKGNEVDGYNYLT